jgi:hypothetical protein
MFDSQSANGAICLPVNGLPLDAGAAKANETTTSRRGENESEDLLGSSRWDHR